MDPVSLTLGLAPIVGGMVKSYKTVYRKLKLFGSADRELARLHKLLNGQQNVFLNEMHFLLRLVAIDKEDVIESMIADGDHDRWKCPELSQALMSFYGRSYESFGDIVDEISSNTTYLLEELDRCKDLDPLEQEAEQRRRERFRQSVHRIGSAAKLACDKTKCDQAVQCLRTANDDLKRLREQAQDLNPKRQQPGTCQDTATTSQNVTGRLSSRPGSAYCTKIKRAARALHKGLSSALPNHQVRLFLDAMAVEEITITNLAILCVQGSGGGGRNIVRVRSRPTWLPPSPETTVEDMHVVETSCKRLKVQEDNQPPESDFLAVPNQSGAKKTRDRLHPTRNLCSELCHEIAGVDGQLGSDRLCSVETTGEAFCHEFYPPGSKYHQAHQVWLATFDKILEFPVETAISMVDQLKLARNIASAVLYFNSTPWLAEYWGAKDLSFFLDANDLSTSLRTLNCGVNFAAKEALGSNTMMEGLDTPPPNDSAGTAVEEAMLLYGIRNMTLHSLGVALLQIGRWHSVQPDDVLQVRKLARQIPRLGPKYRELTQKCLECDFRCGNNLSRPQLQQAVYEDVVEELDAMIKCLDLSDDEQP
jgi:hypothetical protein